MFMPEEIQAAINVMEQIGFKCTSITSNYNYWGPKQEVIFTFIVEDDFRMKLGKIVT
jgi:hypothetical protein